MSECSWEKEFYKKMCNNYKDLDGKDCHNLKGSDPQRIIDFFRQKEKEIREEERKKVIAEIEAALSDKWVDISNMFARVNLNKSESMVVSQRIMENVIVKLKDNPLTKTNGV